MIVLAEIIDRTSRVKVPGGHCLVGFPVLSLGHMSPNSAEGIISKSGSFMIGS